MSEAKEAVDLLEWFLAIDLIPNRRTKDSESLILKRDRIIFELSSTTKGD